MELDLFLCEIQCLDLCFVFVFIGQIAHCTRRNRPRYKLCRSIGKVHIINSIRKIQVTCFQSTDQGPDYCRIEVPMHIVPSTKLGSACLQTLIGLPSILSMEEEEAYQKTTQNKDLDLVTKIHNCSVYTKSLCHVIDVMNGPVLQSLESRLQYNTGRIQALEEERKELLAILDST